MIKRVFPSWNMGEVSESGGTCCCGLHCSCDGNSQDYSSGYFGGYFDTLNTAIMTQ